MASIKALPTLESQYNSLNLDAAIRAMFERAKVPDNYPLLVRWEIVKYHKLDRSLGITPLSVYSLSGSGLSVEDKYMLGRWLLKVQNHYIDKYISKFTPEYQQNFAPYDPEIDALPDTLENVDKVYWQAFHEAIVSRSKIGVSKITQGLTWIGENRGLILGGIVVGGILYGATVLGLSSKVRSLVTVNE